ncbi:hypothetical protein SAMN06265367_102525 [Algoriphagus winogradskyi]|jgi:hypothetical protein|uniref:Uncharacterized protein n=1 Tax=Algoriphagus winogradskyi TaxID=237017 RepID=A0ABY1NQX6_9BACT|nr:hypothetical protein SAMN06265367_102525 [Algoriphagus winogradskyi]
MFKILLVVFGFDNEFGTLREFIFEFIFLT